MAVKCFWVSLLFSNFRHAFSHNCWARHIASANLGTRDRENTIIHYHAQELAPSNLNDAIPRADLDSFSQAGLLGEELWKIFSLDVDVRSYIHVIATVTSSTIAVHVVELRALISK